MLEIIKVELQADITINGTRHKKGDIVEVSEKAFPSYIKHKVAKKVKSDSRHNKPNAKKAR